MSNDKHVDVMLEIMTSNYTYRVFPTVFSYFFVIRIDTLRVP